MKLQINKLRNVLNGWEWVDAQDHKIDSKQGSKRNVSKKIRRTMARKVRRNLNNPLNW
jgi:hypothetical protein